MQLEVKDKHNWLENRLQAQEDYFPAAPTHRTQIYNMHKHQQRVLTEEGQGKGSNEAMYNHDYYSILHIHRSSTRSYKTEQESRKLVEYPSNRIPS